jgi:hypothetical protein
MDSGQPLRGFRNDAAQIFAGNITRRRLLHVAAGTGLLVAPHLARAAFAERPLRIMVGFAAGGTVDTIARILAQAMTPLIMSTAPAAFGAFFRAEVARWTEVAWRAGITAQ